MQVTPEQEARLRAAVDEINDAMADILSKCGESVSVRPWANFSTDSGYAEIEVEITTGRIRIPSKR